MLIEVARRCAVVVSQVQQLSRAIEHRRLETCDLMTVVARGDVCGLRNEIRRHSFVSVRRQRGRLRTVNEYPLTVFSIPPAYLRTLVCKHQLTINNRVTGGSEGTTETALPPPTTTHSGRHLAMGLPTTSTPRARSNGTQCEGPTIGAWHVDRSPTASVSRCAAALRRSDVGRRRKIR
jgi:hypothetical protein